MGRKPILAFLSAFLFISVSYSQTMDEMTASMYALAAIAELEQMEGQKVVLVNQIVAKNVTIQALKSSFKSIEQVSKWWEEKSKEKPKFKDLSFWQKLWAYLKGGVVGVAVGAVIVIAAAQ